MNPTKRMFREDMTMPRRKRASKLLGDGAKANFTEKAKCPSVEGWVKNVQYTQQTVTRQ